MSEPIQPAVPESALQEAREIADCTVEHEKLYGQIPEHAILSSILAHNIAAALAKRDEEIARQNAANIEMSKTLGREMLRITELEAHLQDKQRQINEEIFTTNGLRNQLATKKDTERLDWLERKSKFIISTIGAHRGYHELPSVAIYKQSGMTGATSGPTMTPTTLRAAIDAAIAQEPRHD